MDLKGQKLAEQIFKILIVLFGIIGWIVGFIAQDVRLFLAFFAAGCIVSAILTVPEWGYLNRNPHKWLPKIVDPEPESTTTTKTETLVDSKKRK